MNYVLAPINDFATLLIGAEGAKTPAGVRGRGDPTGAIAPRRLPGCPRKAKRLKRKSTGKFQRTRTFKGTFQCPPKIQALFKKSLDFCCVYVVISFNLTSSIGVTA